LTTFFITTFFPKKKMRETTLLVEAHVPRVLAQLAVRFFTARKPAPYSKLRCGEGESLRACTDLGIALGAACRGGNNEVVFLMIARGRNAAFQHNLLGRSVSRRPPQTCGLVDCKRLQRLGFGTVGGLPRGPREHRALDDRKGRHEPGLAEHALAATKRSCDG
jgi:hypothetical protein